MGRSVSTHRHAVATVFINPEIEEDGYLDFIADLQDNVLSVKYPSLNKCSRWMDREDHVIAENGRAEVSVSEYCGLVSVCLAPRDPDSGLDVAWCERVANSFTKYIQKMFASCALRSLGHMSNGEQVFQRA